MLTYKTILAAGLACVSSVALANVTETIRIHPNHALHAQPEIIKVYHDGHLQKVIVDKDHHPVVVRMHEHLTAPRHMVVPQMRPHLNTFQHPGAEHEQISVYKNGHLVGQAIDRDPQHHFLRVPLNHIGYGNEIIVVNGRHANMPKVIGPHAQHGKETFKQRLVHHLGS